MPNKQGRFFVSWIPSVEMQNSVINKNGLKMARQ